MHKADDLDRTGVRLALDKVNKQLVSSTNGQPESPKRGKNFLLGHWSFEDPARSKVVSDSSGNKRHGTLVGLMLDLSFTGVTDAGVAELQKALPNCVIGR